MNRKTISTAFTGGGVYRHYRNPDRRVSGDIFGYEYAEQVPVIDGTFIRHCATCDLWFAARPREEKCDGCVPDHVRTDRAVKSTPEVRAHFAIRRFQRDIPDGSRSLLVELLKTPLEDPSCDLSNPS